MSDKHFEPAAGEARELEEIAEAARFPAENPNPVFRVAADGRVLYANRASRRLLAAWGVVPDGCVPAQWCERLAEVLTTGAARIWDAPCDDQVLQLHCIPILGRGYVNVYAANVTERMALLAQLTEQASRAERHVVELEATLEAITDGVVIYAPDGTIARQNAAAARLLGWAPAEQGGSMTERRARLQAQLVDDPAAGVERMPAGRALRGETVQGELMRLRPADQPDSDPRYVQASSAPIRNADGALLGAVASFSDITELRKTRDELAKRVEELEKLLELLPIGVAISYDPECKDIRVNPALAWTLGMAPDANVSLGSDENREGPPYRVFDPSGRELAVEQLPMQAAAGRGAEVRDLEIEILRRDGARLTMLSSAAPLLDAAGKLRGAVAGYVDISKRREAEVERERLLRELEVQHGALKAQAAEIRVLNAGLEQRVQERTAELEAIFASVPDALYVVDESRVLRCNQAVLDAFGCASVDELNAKGRELVSQMWPRHADTGQPIPPAELERAPALRGERAVVEMTIYHRATQQDRTYRVAAAPVPLNSKTVAAVAVATDITEQKQARAQIDYLANLVENVNDAILAYDADLRVTAWNRKAEELYGWSAAEAVGSYVGHAVGSQVTDEERANAMHALRETGRWQGEVRHARRDGTPIIVESTTVSLRNEAGDIYGFATVNRDITARKRTDDELRASREQLQRLSRRLVMMQESERSYVADQLYNQAGQVLAALQMQLSRLGKEGGRGSPHKLGPLMEATVQEAMRELHELATQLRPVGLDRSLLAGVLGRYVAEFCAAHGLLVEYDPGDAETLRVPSDVATALYRSVQGGLTNIARHAHASQVKLSLSQETEWLTVTLADDGVGFQPTSDPSMNGLGLASIRERLETVGGALRIESGAWGTRLIMQTPSKREEQPI